MIVIVCCGGKKADVPMPAAEMYRGRYFKMCLKYARSIAKEKDIYIMSAKHGFMRTTKVIAPYDATMEKSQSLTASMLQQQARALRITNQECIFIGGKPYRLLAQQVFKEFYAPFVEAPVGILPSRDVSMPTRQAIMNQHLGKVPRRQL
jgi:hypothetical protein